MKRLMIMGLLTGALLAGVVGKVMHWWHKNSNQDKFDLEHFDDIWGKLSDPKLVEKRFLELLPQAQQLPNKSTYLQLLSQIALAQACLKKFDCAHTTLDDAEKLLTPEYDLARVRILCERGRVFQQAGDIKQAKIYFEKSYALSVKCGFDTQTINVAHMIAIVADTAAEKIAWNQKALDLAMRGADSHAQRWAGPILNNLGSNYVEIHKYQEALTVFSAALVEFEKYPECAAQVRFARFRIAQVLRMLGRLDEALSLLHQQVEEYDDLMKNGKIDMPSEMFALMRGWLYEELSVVYSMRNEIAMAQKYAKLALGDLEDNATFIITNPDALQRIQDMRDRI